MEQMTKEELLSALDYEMDVLEEKIYIQARVRIRKWAVYFKHKVIGLTESELVRFEES